ncbi:MAG: hypothetical protein AAFX87_18025 [Bacteroidota bacterium]
MVRKGFKILIYGLFILGFIAIFGYTVMLLWNWLIPDIFQGPEITFWQAIGLLILCKILFSDFGSKGGGKGPKKRHWRRKVASKLEHMDPEDRERFKQKLKEKWGMHCFNACYRYKQPHV